MSMRKAQDRALHYGRTRFKPGLGLCSCSVCKQATEVARQLAEDGKERPAVGSPVEGCKYVNYEKSFADAWEEQQHQGGGMPLVQRLMIVYPKGGPQSLMGVDLGRMAFWLTPRERVIVASIVQWLGTNVGMGFLHEALRRCGLFIMEVSTRDAWLQRARSADQEVKDVLELLDLSCRAAGAVDSSHLHSRIEQLVQERDEAYATLARLNLDPLPAGSTAAIGLFATLDDGEI